MALTRPRYSQIYDTDYKQSVRAATTGPVGNLLATSNMTNTVDGVTLAVNDRILVKDQADAKQNGIYFVLTLGTGADGTWRRSLDADGGTSKVTSGLTTTVTEGNDNASKTFKLSTPDPILVGTTELTFVNPFVITATAGGANTQIQFNDTGGVLNGSAGLTFNKFSNTVTISNTLSTSNFTLGSQQFYSQGNNGFSVNENYDSSANSLQTAYHFTSGAGREEVAFTLARTGEFTDGFGIYGTAADNTFVNFGEQSNTKWEWRSGIGIQPLNLDGGTLRMRLYSSGNLAVSGNVSATYFTGNGALLTGLDATKIESGTSNIRAFSSGNVAVSVAGTSNVAVFTSSQVVVSGNLTVTGNLTYLNVDNIVTQDALIYVANGNQFDFLDIGIVGNFTKNSFNQHGGIVRDASDSIWKFFANVESEPTTTVDFGSATYDSILAGNVLSTGNVVVGANITLNGRLFAGGSAGNSSDVLISTGSGVSWAALDQSTLSFDTSSLTLDNVWGNLILNNTSSVSFADADSTSIFHSNVEVNKNLTVDQRLTAQTANIAGLLISSANIQMNPGTGGGHFRIINGYGGGFQIDGEGPRMGLGTTANIFAYLHIWSVSNNNYINSTTRPLIIGFSPSSAGANILYMDPTNGNTVLNTNTASISSATGALVVAGGVGVVGNLNVGGNFTAGVVGSSNLQVTGGGSFSGTLTVGGSQQVAKTIGFTSEYDNGSSGSSYTIDFNNGQKQRITLTAAPCTLSFTAPTVGVGNFLLKIIQDGGGSKTITWPATVKWPNGTGPTLSTAAGAVDIVTLYYDGTNYYSVASLNFS